jgi:NAD(P)-dependent dehydrogenase (short-subunit alcohol dehydrogenase family)
LKAHGGRGKIINITSVHETIPSPGNAAYGAAKGGLLTFTRSLALELAPLRINVNAIAPGLIRTPMTAKRTEDPEKMREELPNIRGTGRENRGRSLAWHSSLGGLRLRNGPKFQDRWRARDELGSRRMSMVREHETSSSFTRRPIGQLLDFSGC